VLREDARRIMGWPADYGKSDGPNDDFPHAAWHFSRIPI
jgi:hypothetical protein